MPELIALTYIGDGAYRPTLPIRDLDAADIAYTAAVQKRSVEDLAAEAIGSGLYRPVYGVEPVAPGGPEGSDIPTYEELTKKELIALAAERGIEVDPNATNAVLRDVLIAADAAVEGDDVEPVDPDSPPLPEA